MKIEQQLVQKLKLLPPDKQQEVLDFVEFLADRTINAEVNTVQKPTVSALTLAHKWVGCVEEGPTDLSTNQKYLDELGTE